MNTAFIILAMIFMHIVDDYYLQGWLASAKQKIWWKANAPEKLYRYDYIWALIMHSFSWTFMIMLPIAYAHSFKITALFVFMFAFNVTMHAITDNAKANRKVINLWQDQLIHLTQIAYTAVALL